MRVGDIRSAVGTVIIELTLAFAILTLTGTGPVSAADEASGTFSIAFGTLNAGVGQMASANHTLASSVGDPLFNSTAASAHYAAATGFWPLVRGVTPFCILDLDGDAKVDALTDGLMLMRVLFGLTGTSVTRGAVAANATRTSYDAIKSVIQVPLLDVDGNGITDALTDGLILVRAMFGLTGVAVTNGAIGIGATRTDWDSIRTYINNSCGATFGP